jgi:hypothetical protein
VKYSCNFWVGSFRGLFLGWIFYIVEVGLVSVKLHIQHAENKAPLSFSQYTTILSELEHHVNI